MQPSLVFLSYMQLSLHEILYCRHGWNLSRLEIWLHVEGNWCCSEVSHLVKDLQWINTSNGGTLLWKSFLWIICLHGLKEKLHSFLSHWFFLHFSGVKSLPLSARSDWPVCFKAFHIPFLDHMLPIMGQMWKMCVIWKKRPWVYSTTLLMRRREVLNVYWTQMSIMFILPSCQKSFFDIFLC